MKNISLSVFMVLVNFSAVSASHIVGHEIFYSIDENGNAELSVVMFRDCYGIEVGTQAPITAISICGDSIEVIANLTSELANDVWPFMPFDDNEVVWNCPSNCNESEFYPRPGIQRFIYRWTGMLPTCNEWNFSHTFCCYSPVLNNVDPSYLAESSVSASAFLPTGQGNSSTRFVASSQFICANDPEPTLFSGYDVDGDSLVYYLSPLYFDRYPNDTIPFISGSSSVQPIPGQSVLLDPNSGLLNSSILSQGEFQIGISVEEYRNGVLIGTTNRSIFIKSTNCQTTGSISTNVLQGNLVNGVLEPTVGQEVIIEYSAQVGNPENYYLHCTTCEHLENYTWSTSMDLQSGTVSATLNWTPVAHELEVPLHVRLLQNECENNFSSTTMLFSIQQGTVTEIGEHVGKNVWVYPNPSNGSFHLESANQISSFELFDCAGKLITSQKWNRSLTEINVRVDASVGIYILKTVCEGQASYHRISIKN